MAFTRGLIVVLAASMAAACAGAPLPSRDDGALVLVVTAAPAPVLTVVTATATPTASPGATPVPVVPAPSISEAPSATPDLPPASGPVEVATVLRVIDGDTIVVDAAGSQETVGYLGVDAPERGFNGAPEPLAEEAAAANSQLLGGPAVYLERGAVDRDASGRSMRYVWIRSDAGWSLLNEALVRVGYGRLDPSLADGVYGALLEQAASAATVGRVGLWTAPIATPVPDPTAAPRRTAVPTVRPVPRATARPTARPTPRPVARPTPRPTARPTPRPRPKPTRRPTPRPTKRPNPRGGCDPSYPTICIPVNSPDLDCKDIPQWRHFKVLPPDPHRFDGYDNDGWGCESN